MTVPAVFVNVSFSTTLGRRRSRGAARGGRRAEYPNSAVVMFLTPLIGRWLDLVGFPANYQAVYLLGFLASLLGVRALATRARPRADRPGAAGRERSSWTRDLLGAPVAGGRLLRANPQFVRLTLNTLVHGIGAWLIAPLYMLYYVRSLGATDTWIGTFTAVASLCAVVGFYAWRRVIGRFGEDRPLRGTIVFTALFPIAVALSGNLTAIVGARRAERPGVAWAGSIPLQHACSRSAPPPRATFISLYSTL